MDFHIGEPFYLNDTNYEELPYWNEFKQLLMQNQFEDAYQYLRDNNIPFIHAGILNHLEDRLYALQRYIEDNKVRITAYGVKPESNAANMIWISNQEET